MAIVRTRYPHIALGASNADIALVTRNIDIALVDPCVVANDIIRDERLVAAIHAESSSNPPNDAAKAIDREKRNWRK
jgi:hypothetical protein